MIDLKVLSKNAIPSAISMANQYRQLNDPGGAESICLDVLEVMPDNQDALITLMWKKAALISRKGINTTKRFMIGTRFTFSSSV